MQIVETICMKYQNLFYGKNKKNFFASLSSAELAQRVVQVNPLSFWTGVCSAFANSVDPDQLASSEAKWSWSALFVIKYI